VAGFARHTVAVIEAFQETVCRQALAGGMALEALVALLRIARHPSFFRHFGRLGRGQHGMGLSVFGQAPLFQWALAGVSATRLPVAPLRTSTIWLLINCSGAT